ncbi:MAG: 6-phosphogluconolactonase, partial [Bacteroidales bacterium]|nr:6-phosphogluconolactonase [Bacteroidales bacterium]
PEDSESNYGTARKMLLENVPMPETHVHRIKGEDEPFAEAGRYGKLVCDFWKDSAGFDMVILGIGSDGHTSSIFPGQKHLLNTDRIYEESVNPYSGQKRIALTAKGILNSANLYFFISGPEKEKIMSVISDNYGNPMYPAGYIMKEASNPMIFWENTGVEPFIIHGIINKMHNVQIVSS